MGSETDREKSTSADHKYSISFGVIESTVSLDSCWEDRGHGSKHQVETESDCFPELVFCSNSFGRPGYVSCHEAWSSMLAYTHKHTALTCSFFCLILVSCASVIKNFVEGEGKFLVYVMRKLKFKGACISYRGPWMALHLVRVPAPVCIQCLKLAMWFWFPKHSSVQMFDIVLGPRADAATAAGAAVWLQGWLIAEVTTPHVLLRTGPSLQFPKQLRAMTAYSHPHSLTFSIIFSPWVLLFSPLKFKHLSSLDVSQLRTGPSLTHSCGVKVGGACSLLSWQPFMNCPINPSQDQSSTSHKLIS